MRVYSVSLGTLALASIVSATAYAGASSDPTGVWIDDTGRGAVEITSCGQALCGHLVWLKNDAGAQGCGLQIIGKAVQTGPATWDKGWIYSPEQHKNFDVEIKPLADGTLQVTGYAGVKFLSKVMIWTRAPADIKRCGEQTATATPVPAEPRSDQPVTGETGSSAKTGTGTETAPPAALPPAPLDEAQKPVSPPSEVAGSPAAVNAGPDVQDEKQPLDRSATVVAPPAASTQSPAQGDASPPSPAAPLYEPEEVQAEPRKERRKQTQANARLRDERDEGHNAKRHGHRQVTQLRFGSLNAGGIFVRSRSGRCKVDLPWVKVHFACQ